MKKMMRFSFGVQAIDPIKDVVEQGGGWKGMNYLNAYNSVRADN